MSTSKRIRNSLLSAAAALAVVALTASTSAIAAPPDEEPAQKEQFDPNQEPLFHADDGPEPTADQSALAERVTEAIESFSLSEADDVTPPWHFEMGIIGFEGSPHEGYTMYVTAESDPEALRDQVVEGLSAEAASQLRVESTNATAAELARIYRFVQSLEWTDREPAYLGSLYPPGGQMQILLSDPVGDEVEKLKAGGGDALRVEITEGLSRYTRANDIPPHWGGARIRSSTNNYCTAGFTVMGKTTGTYYSTTAGHCGANGTSFYSPGFYGNIAGNDSYPTRDVARLRGSTYQNTIYTDGQDMFATRVVTGARNGEVGDNVCQSGFVSGSVCLIKIVSLNSYICSGGCTYGLGEGLAPAGVIGSRTGDSGAPVYHRNTSLPRASIRGSLVGGNGGRSIVWERYSVISSYLNSVVVASP